MKNEGTEHEPTKENLGPQNLLEYYLDNLDNEEIMEELRWENPSLFRKIQRIHYIDSLRSKEPTGKCPECKSKTIIVDNDTCEEYCENCGLVTRNNYPYVAGIQHELYWGLKI